MWFAYFFHLSSHSSSKLKHAPLIWSKSLNAADEFLCWRTLPHSPFSVKHLLRESRWFWEQMEELIYIMCRRWHGEWRRAAAKDICMHERMFIILLSKKMLQKKLLLISQTSRYYVQRHVYWMEIHMCHTQMCCLYFVVELGNYSDVGFFKKDGSLFNFWFYGIKNKIDHN
jgi:hypothetical protein